MNKLFYLILFLSITYSSSKAELDESAFSFSNLFIKSNIIAYGSVKDIIITSNEHKIIFEIENCISQNSNIKLIEINVPLSNGFFIPDEPYLEKNNHYLLFLNNSNNNWTITNKIGGVFNSDFKNDIIKIFEKFNYNKKLFEKDNKNDLKNLYFLFKNNLSKSKFLYDLKNILDTSDMPFLVFLFESQDKQAKLFAISQFGILANESMQPAIIELIQNSDDFDIKFHCIAALGNLKKTKNYPILLLSLNDPDPGIRRVAIEALGKLKNIEMINSLKELYPRETDMGQRLAIITAITRLSDLNLVIQALMYFQNIETDPYILSIINNRINSNRN